MTNETIQDYTRPPAEAAGQLSALSAAFPNHHITAERTADDVIHYVARNRRDDVHPRLVVTHDLRELSALLGESIGVQGS